MYAPACERLTNLFVQTSNRPVVRVSVLVQDVEHGLIDHDDGVVRALVLQGIRLVEFERGIGHEEADGWRNEEEKTCIAVENANRWNNGRLRHLAGRKNLLVAYACVSAASRPSRTGNAR